LITASSQIIYANKEDFIAKKRNYYIILCME